MNDAVSHEPRAWTARRWWTLVVVVFLVHVALVFTLGAKKLRPVRSVTNVPHVQWAAAEDEWIALNDPTLFALPQGNDFGADIRRRIPPVNKPSFRWTEPPRWLALTTETLGRDFGRFMQTNIPPGWALDFKPAPEFNEPAVPAAPELPRSSTLRLRGELTGRTLLTAPALPNWPAGDVLAPSKVQVLVDPAGRVISAVLLPPDIGLESALRDDNADQTALSLARAARFAPGSRLTVGQMIFNWQAIPLPATNAPANLP
jgi:hypothetical protein